MLASGFAALADQAATRERTAGILVKALSYDNNIVARAGPEMVVAVVYPATASDEAEAWRQAFARLASLKFLSLPFRAVKLALTTTDRLRESVVKEGIDALFVLDASKDDLAAIQKVAREKKVLTLASRQEQVSNGLSLGVFTIDGKSTLLLNLTNSREEGAVFDNAIFTLAKVIK